MKEYEGTLSEYDYEQLPPTLRRKYFSSLERLRLAQDGAYPIYPSRNPREPQRALTSSHPSSFPTRRSIRRPSTTLDDYLLPSSPSIRNKLRKHSGVAPVLPQQVARFATLPPVLQRKHFSREEQVLLASRINHVILDAADEVLYKQYGTSSRASLSYQEPPSADDLEDIESQGEDMGLSEDELESLRWLDEEEDLDLSLYDYHAAVAETAQNGQSLNRRISHRNYVPSSSAAFSRRSSSTISFGGHSVRPLPSPTSLHGPSKLYHSVQTRTTHSHHQKRASTSSLDPSAAHYQDPAARMKLRVYLASPQKFDEAIEFGFPSMQESMATRQVQMALPAIAAGSNSHLVSNDDTPSLSDGDDQEGDCLDSPRTPEVSTFSSTFPKSKESSLDRTSFKPKLMRDLTEPYSHALASNREMTLHMTLTRPDLRSPEEGSSSREINARPLEQAPLHFSDDSTDFWDSLPDHESKVKKLFKKLRLRS